MLWEKHLSEKLGDLFIHGIRVAGINDCPDSLYLPQNGLHEPKSRNQTFIAGAALELVRSVPNGKFRPSILKNIAEQ
ncbi:MAG: hypothetical protein PHD32_11615 [Eubacteriales bacterium]|nr:hypothetical protein [Eubacteriales bacterium]